MRFPSSRRLLGGLTLVLAAGVLLAGCSDDRTEPLGPSPAALAPTADPSLLGGLLGGVVGNVANTLLACPASQTYSATKIIGPAGGTITVGRHSLYVPPYALTREVEITATAPAGEYAEVQFAPHGLQFERSTVLRLSYSECGLVGQLVSPLLLRVVYVGEDLNILERLPSLVDLFSQRVTAKTDHFSAYMLAY